MGTIILAGIIFLGVARVVYKYGVKKEKTCDCSSADCPIKKETISNKWLQKLKPHLKIFIYQGGVLILCRVAIFEWFYHYYK